MIAHLLQERFTIVIGADTDAAVIINTVTKGWHSLSMLSSPFYPLEKVMLITSAILRIVVQEREF